MEALYDLNDLPRLQRAWHGRFTQDEISLKTGVSQGQVSRVLAGYVQRPSKAFQEICIYVFSDRSSGKYLPRRGADWERLSRALDETWDGSAHHARALESVLSSLRALRRQYVTSNHS